MTIHVTELGEYIADEPRGTGCLSTERGNLPLHKLDVRAAVTGLVARTQLIQGFRNPYDVPLEATYIFPLPDRAALTAMTLTADGRTIVADLQERAKARKAYDEAIAQVRRASIAEEERPDVFTMRVGNIAPGEQVEVSLTVIGPLPFEDGEATFRFPLVVAPRYIPGRPLPGERAGDGYAPDTDSTPDASRITPPVLLPGFPNPVALSIEVAIDAAGLPLGDVRSSLHTATAENGTIRVQPGERVDRDFILRLPYGEAALPAAALTAVADGEGDEGTFQLTVVPPPASAGTRGKDVVLLLDRSGSMQGWKMVAARRAAARIVDTLGAADRFAVLTFDDRIEHPADLPHGLVAATDRHRYRAVEHLSRADARGGTVLLEPLTQGLNLLTAGESGRDRVLVLITDGQVGNEDQILEATAPLLRGVRVHTVGIDQAVNAGFLGRLAVAGGGRCELVESEDRLDTAMDSIHRRISAPLVTGLRLAGDGVIDGTVSPTRLSDLFTGVPLVIRGRYRGAAPTLTLSGSTRDGTAWEARAEPAAAEDRMVAQLWARATLRDLEDAYAGDPYASEALEQRIVATSLRFGVLCRFTAFVALDSRVVNEHGELHQVIQPVELPAGWAPHSPMPAQFGAVPMAASAAMDTSGGLAPRSMHLAGGGASPAVRRPKARLGRPPLGDSMQHSDSELAAARTQAAEEARRLEQPAASELARRDTLDDLASRLDALVRHLESRGVDASPLRSIIEMLRDDTVSSADRWEQARRALTEFAQAAASASPSTQRQFWKRR
ncbi:MAG: Ca-activated chloride channel [Pseudonocardiales bacterium]|nr:Ca-activated chloride channel [Pseudonocardiales bacterium]